MEWKEDALKATIVALLGFIGHAFLKFFKRSIYPLKKVLKDANKVNGLEVEQHYISQLLQSFIHVMPYPMYIMDIKGDLEYVNPAWCTVTGFRDPEDAYGMGFMRAIPDRHVELMMKRNEQFVKHPSNFEGVVTMQHIYTLDEFTANCRTELIYLKDKKVFKTIGILEIIKQ